MPPFSVPCAHASPIWLPSVTLGILTKLTGLSGTVRIIALLPEEEVAEEP